MKNSLKIIVFIFVNVILFWFTFSVDFQSCDLMADKLTLNHNLGSVKNFSQSFCNKIEWQACQDWDQVFVADKSVFVKLFCNNVWVWDKFPIVESWFLKTWFSDFGIFDYGLWDKSSGFDIDLCDSSVSTLNGCDFWYQLPKMFDSILNDYFDIKQVGEFKITNEDDLQTILDNFSNDKFPGMKNTICDPDSDYYKDTCNYLKNYVSKTRNLLNKTSVINVEKISEDLSDNQKNCDFSNKDRDLVYCGLFDDTNSELSFMNLIYNEYLWYNIFWSYYNYELSTYHNYAETQINDIREKIAANQNKVYNFRDNLYKTKQAMDTSFRSLFEMFNSFALHIWFMMYQEDANMFMKKLSKIYPPLVTLYDKLRNVQEAE